MNELNRLYEAVLLALGCKIDTHHKVTVSVTGKEYPLRIDGRDLYLPVSEALNDASNKVYFHPTCESIVSKETEVFKLLRRLAGLRLMSIFREMIPTLFDIAAKSKDKKSWNQAVYNVISPLVGIKKNVKDDVLNLLTKLNIETEDNVDNRFIHFKITKGGKGLAGERVYYKAKPSFPLYDILVRELARTEGQPKNSSVSVNNYSVCREAIEVTVHLFRAILPMVNNPDNEERDALIPVAARFTALMYCFAAVSEQLNRAQNMFRGDFDKKGIYGIDISWEETLEEIPEFYRQVPELDYNSHNVYKEGDQQNMALGSGFGDMFMINSSTTTQSTGMITNTTNGEDRIQMINGMQFNMKVPQMINGDRYTGKSEVDLFTNRIKHYAMNAMNQMVVYICSQMGNLLHQEAPQQNYGMGQQMYPNQFNNGYPNPYNNGYPNQQQFYQPSATPSMTGGNNGNEMNAAW